MSEEIKTDIVDQPVKILKTWSHITFSRDDAVIEVAMNHQTGEYYLSEPSQDQNVKFKGNKDIDLQFKKLRCIKAALIYIKYELV